jgi:hypothetical protein
MNLWDPSGAGGVAIVLATAFLLGMVHGITPDEHTWPITFSYAVGSYSSRGGMRAGFLFSFAFMFQRALASELAFFALAGILSVERWEYAVYAIVGAVMAMSGFYLLRTGRIPHLFHTHAVDAGERADREEASRKVLVGMPLLHGFIAGWGTGAFALIIYGTLSPAMHSPWLAFLPGLCFGLGTMAMQILFGGAIGAWAAQRRLGDRALKFFARSVSGKTLAYGGLAFVAAGVAGLIAPKLFGWSFATGIRVHNLAHLGVGFVLVVIVVVTIAGSASYTAYREISKRAEASAA